MLASRSVCAKDQAPCSPNRDKHGRRVAASHGYPDLNHAHVQSQVLWIDRLVESSSSKNVSLYTIHKSNKQFDWNGSGTKTGQACRYALRWFFFLSIYYLSYHCSEWVRKQWNKKETAMCQPYHFRSDFLRNIISDQMRRSRSHGGLRVFGWPNEQPIPR